MRLETGGMVQNLTYSLGLSLLLNYGLVVGLTAFHLYTSAIIYLVLVAEGILLLLCFKPGEKHPLTVTCRCPDFSTGGRILLVAAAMAIAALVYYAAVNAGEVFRLFDAVVSWNRWAVDWAHNTFPYKTAEYPQLIPANWSLTYVIINNYDVQLFARALMPLFPLGIMLLLLDWSFKQNSQEGLAAVLFFSLMMLYFYEPAAMIDGYVDIAVAFFGLLVCSSIYHQSADGLRSWREMLVAGLFAAGAALTKQAGIFVLAAFAGWSVWYIRKNYSGQGREAARCLSTVLAVIVIVGAWYLAKELQIARGMDYSAVQLVTHDIYGGASLPQRLINGAGLLVNARGEAGFPIFVVLSAAFVSGLGCRRTWIGGILSIVYIIIWGLFFSYDTRNLTLVYPVLALIMARGISVLIGPWSYRWGWGLIIITISLAGFTFLTGFFKTVWLSHNLVRWGMIAAIVLGAVPAVVFIKRGRLILPGPVLLFTLLVLVIGAGSYVYTAPVLTASQLEKQEQLGITGLNQMVYQYERQQGINGKILSDYIFLPFLPDLREKAMYRQWPAGIYTALQQESDLGALLISNTALARGDINKAAAKRFVTVFSSEGYTFLIDQPEYRSGL